MVSGGQWCKLGFCSCESESEIKEKPFWVGGFELFVDDTNHLKLYIIGCIIFLFFFLHLFFFFSS